MKDERGRQAVGGVLNENDGERKERCETLQRHGAPGHMMTCGLCCCCLN
jgi:hypothetical protein